MRRQAATCGGARRTRAHTHTLARTLTLSQKCCLLPPSKASTTHSPARSETMRSSYSHSPPTLGRRRLDTGAPTYMAVHEASLCMRPAYHNQRQPPFGLTSRKPLPVSPGASRQAGRVSCSAARRRPHCRIRAGGPAGMCARRALSSRPRAGRRAERLPTPTRARAARSASPAAA